MKLATCNLPLAVIFLLLASSCVKVTLHNTPHPTTGALVVHPVWTGADGNTPAEYAVEVDGEAAHLGGSEACYPALLPPGSVTWSLYNTAAGITVTNGFAEVNVSPTTVITTVGNSAPVTITETVLAKPGDFYAGTGSIDIAADDTTRLEARAALLTRQLTLTLNITEGNAGRIASATGLLSGVAARLSLDGTISPAPGGTALLTFTRSGTILSSVIPVMGIATGESAILRLTLVYTNGSAETIESDLTDPLGDFNDKHHPVEGDLKLPAREGNFSATIEGWKDGGGEDVEAK